MSVKKNLNLKVYVNVLAQKTAQGVAVEARNIARDKVAVDKGRLRNNIRTEQISKDDFITLSDTPYSLAQEFGLEPFGKPNYTFTPYMRPAAEQVVNIDKLTKIVQEANQAALRAAII